MHSLKNTVIAVGLLGLSFLFYQASSKKSPDADGMMPAMEISDSPDSMHQHVGETGEAIQSKIGSLQAMDMPKVDMPNIKTPDFSNSNQTDSRFGQGVKEKSQANGPARFSGPDDAAPKIELPALNPPTPNQPKSDRSGFGSNDFAAKSSHPSFNRRPLDIDSRDEGLIAALDQNQFAKTSADNSFGTQPVSTQPNDSQAFNPGKNSFGSQPIPTSDSSFNQLATDTSNKRDANVIQLDSDSDLESLDFQSAWPYVQDLSDQKKYREALRVLSRFYRSDELTGPQRQRLVAWLDALASKVIFSDEHHLSASPYTVANESLVDVGKRWHVPAQLIYNINRSKIPNPALVAPGTPLKIVEGPFDAEIDLQQNVMTLFLGDLYAGRYPIRVGISGSPKPGEFRVLVKSADGHLWRDSAGNDYPPGTPENGYGPNWIGLSGSLCIHEVGDSATQGHRGCIGLRGKDAKDVFSILADGSNVKILR